jgi:Uma2 family endonuclease
MSSAAVKTRFTPEQYLALERKAAFKSEYVDGCIRAMAGASRAHNLIAVNLSREISSQLKDRPCETYAGDMRVRTGPSGLYTYPDVVVVCGEPRFEDDELDTLLNPTMIVEVLSPSTEADDRGHKFASYRRLTSLQEYVLVAQDRRSVERYTRQDDAWLLTDLNGPEDMLRLASIHVDIALSEIYAKVPLVVDGPADGV